MRAELITMQADKSTTYQTADGTQMQLTVKAHGADAVIFDIKETDHRLHVHARGTGFARLTEETPSGTVDLSDPKVGTWFQGIPSDSIVTNDPIHESDPEELAAYGGYVVCESVDPKLRPLIIAAPQMWTLLVEAYMALDHIARNTQEQATSQIAAGGAVSCYNMLKRLRGGATE